MCPKLTIVLAVLAVAPSALADDTRPGATQKGYQYDFPDEALLGGGLGSNGGVLVLRPPGTRVLLLRPRVQFVPEMLKSVENL
jgi:hypothetical protein